MKKPYTPTEKRIMDLLSDGMAHPVPIILERCFEDELTTASSLRVHITNLRDKIPNGYDIVSRNGSYRLIRYNPLS